MRRFVFTELFRTGLESARLIMEAGPLEVEGLWPVLVAAVDGLAAVFLRRRKILKPMAQLSRQVTRKRFGNAIRLFACFIFP